MNFLLLVWCADLTIVYKLSTVSHSRGEQTTSDAHGYHILFPNIGYLQFIHTKSKKQTKPKTNDKVLAATLARKLNKQ